MAKITPPVVTNGLKIGGLGTREPRMPVVGGVARPPHAAAQVLVETTALAGGPALVGPCGATLPVAARRGAGVHGGFGL